MAVKSCPLELRDIHPEHIDRNVKDMISDILEAKSNVDLLLLLNKRSEGSDTEQVQSQYIV
jgi:hypothetical protein